MPGHLNAMKQWITAGTRAVLALGLGWSVGVSPAMAQPKAHLGISVSADWSSRTYANLMLMAPPMWVLNQGWVFAPQDAAGWPTTDGEYYVHDPNFAGPMNTMAGRYRMSFNGRATVTAKWNNLTRLSQTYDAVTNRTVIDWQITDARPTIWFVFTQTRRTNTSATNTGVTNVKLMRPQTLGGNDPYPETALFTNEYLDAHRRGQVLRMMDFTATNWNIQRNWSERPLPTDPSYHHFRSEGYGWQGRGSPWEHAIALCNAVDKDIWVNVPHRATDDYVRQLARLLRDTLEPERKVYVEYSNETWNDGFSQATWAMDQARAEVNAGGSNLNYDGETWDRVWQARWIARRVMQVSDLFRSEFGAPAMMTRVRPVLTTQSVWQHWISRGLTFLDDWYNNGDGNHVTTPRPVNAYLWGAGGAGYYDGINGSVMDAATNLDQIFAEYNARFGDFYAFKAYDAHWCAAFGLRRVAYESGPGVDTDRALMLQAQTDPRMKQVYRRMVDTYYEAGGDLWVHFLGVNTAHGLLPWDSAGTQPKPKQEAFDEAAAAASRPAPTLGFLAPGTVNVGRFSVSHASERAGTSDSAVTFNGRGQWTAHSFRLTNAAPVTVQVASASGTGSVTVEVNGTVVGTIAVPGTGTVQSALLEPGLHAVRLRHASGSFSLRTVSVALAAARTVSGRVILGDWSVSPTGKPVTFEFRNANNEVVEQVTTTLSSTSNFSFTTYRTGTFHLTAKGTHFLRARRVNVNFTGSSVVGQNFTLVNGDVDGDNAITVFDYDRLSASFDLSIGQAGFDADADLDGDGTVTVFDYDILSGNFDLVGVN